MYFRVNPSLLLQIVDNSIKVYKGTNPEVDSYSVFWDNKKLTETTLVSQLQEKNATDIYICGLAYDVCVGRFQCSKDIWMLTFVPETICCLNGMVIQHSCGSEMLGALLLRLDSLHLDTCVIFVHKTLEASANHSN